jgi:hypothetical protein
MEIDYKKEILSSKCNPENYQVEMSEMTNRLKFSNEISLNSRILLEALDFAMI